MALIHSKEFIPRITFEKLIGYKSSLKEFYCILSLYFFHSVYCISTSCQLQLIGFVSIDRGATRDYKDEETGIRHQTDRDFIATGTNFMVAPNVEVNYPYFGGYLNIVRSFPVENRNCYTLKPKQGKNKSY